jgi:hypothetical protein
MWNVFPYACHFMSPSVRAYPSLLSIFKLGCLFSFSLIHDCLLRNLELLSSWGFQAHDDFPHPNPGLGFSCLYLACAYSAFQLPNTCYCNLSTLMLSPLSLWVSVTLKPSLLFFGEFGGEEQREMCEFSPPFLPWTPTFLLYKEVWVQVQLIRMVFIRPFSFLRFYCM